MRGVRASFRLSAVSEPKEEEGTRLGVFAPDCRLRAPLFLFLPATLNTHMLPRRACRAAVSAASRSPAAPSGSTVAAVKLVAGARGISSGNSSSMTASGGKKDTAATAGRRAGMLSKHMSSSASSRAAEAQLPKDAAALLAASGQDVSFLASRCSVRARELREQPA